MLRVITEFYRKHMDYSNVRNGFVAEIYKWHKHQITVPGYLPRVGEALKRIVSLPLGLLLQLGR